MIDLLTVLEGLPVILGEKSLHMEDLIDPILQVLPQLLENESEWKSLYIDYEPLS